MDTNTDTNTETNTTPDLSFYLAVHRHMRSDLVRYVDTVAALTPADRSRRLPALVRWVKGFICELEEHHYVEDVVFFPEMQARIPAVADTIERLAKDHEDMDVLLARWPALIKALADPRAPFEPAKAAALAMGRELSSLLHSHLDIEDDDILPMYWRHYTVEEYDAIQKQAIKDGKKKGFSFVAPWSVESLQGAELEAFLAQVPVALKIFHRLVKPRYDRMIATAYGPPDPVRV